MKIKWRSFIFTLLLLFFIAIILVNTGALSPVAAMIPRKVVILTLLLLMMQVISDLQPLWAKKFGKIEQATSKQDNSDVKVVARNAQHLSAYIWLFMAPVLIVLVGFVPFAALYLFFFLRIRGKESRTKSLAIAASGSLILLILFSYLPGAALYWGELWKWLGN